MSSAEQIVELYTFFGIKRLERYYGKTTYFIITFSIVLCDIFLRDTKVYESYYRLVLRSLLFWLRRKQQVKGKQAHRLPLILDYLRPMPLKI